MTLDHDSGAGSLDDLLGLDPEPRFSSEAQANLRRRLVDARMDAALDADAIAVPVGLSERVIRRVRDHEAPAQQRKRGLPWKRVAALPLVAAAAALAIWTFRGGQEPNGRGVDEPVSAELLASLQVLENLPFLTEELDPVEADALFLLSMDDLVLLDLLDIELDDVELDAWEDD